METNIYLEVRKRLTTDYNFEKVDKNFITKSDYLDKFFSNYIIYVKKKEILQYALTWMKL